METWEPRFTFHGFRYVELDRLPGQARPRRRHRHRRALSDTPPGGTFECSNPLVNQLQSNIVWGQRGNFLAVPTDCPQRDERLGWMGDAQIFIRTATYNMDVSRFLHQVVIRTSRMPSARTAAFTDVSPVSTAAAPAPRRGATPA